MPFDRTQDGPRGMTRQAKLLTVMVVAAAAVTVAACFIKRGPTVEPVASDDNKAKEQLFRNWPTKLDAVVIVSGQQHGYLDPCGCSRPQIGGLIRRYNLIEDLKGRGWPILAVDAGDIAQREAPAKLPNVQGIIKYKYAMEALKRMGYTAVSVGEYEAAMRLQTVLGEFALNNPLPTVLVANLDKRDEHFPEQQAAWKIETIKGTDLKVGIVGVVGPSVAHKIKEFNEPDVNFPDGSVDKALDSAIEQMNAKSKPDLRVLLYQGQPAEARACAKKHPNRFQIIACISTFDEPPSESEIVKEAGTMIVTVGHKGKYVGAVGVNRTGKDNPKFELRYQLVRLGEEYLTPDGKEKGHPIMELMEAYTKELKRENYLAKYRPSKHPLQVGVAADQKPVYVGSDRCKKCHESAYEIWAKLDKGHGHSNAYQTLVDAKKPANRQYDGECIVCHTVGFAYESGYRNEKETPNLKNVGCESCHGPASQHVKKPNDAALREALNPWKHDARKIEIDLCVKCHDPDNDVNWSFDKWKKIIHNNPKDE